MKWRFSGHFVLADGKKSSSQKGNRPLLAVLQVLAGEREAGNIACIRRVERVVLVCCLAGSSSRVCSLFHHRRVPFVEDGGGLKAY